MQKQMKQQDHICCTYCSYYLHFPLPSVLSFPSLLAIRRLYKSTASWSLLLRLRLMPCGHYSGSCRMKAMAAWSFRLRSMNCKCYPGACSVEAWTPIHLERPWGCAIQAALASKAWTRSHLEMLRIGQSKGLFWCDSFPAMVEIWW